MGSTTRQQVLQIALLALTASSVCRAQQLPPAQATPAADAAAPAAEVKVAEDAPVVAPKVVCSGDQMTISANNSTLSSVLNEVHRCMGTKIDLPEGAGDKRMYDRLGPGPNSQILEEFLSNTGYNYVIGASPANAEKIDSIMLLARVADPAAITNAITDGRPLTASRRAFLQMHQAAIPHPMTDADNAAAAAATTPAPDPAPSDAAAAPAATDPPAAQPADANPNPNPVQPEVPVTTTPVTPPANAPTAPPRAGSTAEQIQNMQQMFELRKQMNQQQNQNQNPNPPQP